MDQNKFLSDMRKAIKMIGERHDVEVKVSAKILSADVLTMALTVGDPGSLELRQLTDPDITESSAISFKHYHDRYKLASDALGVRVYLDQTFYKFTGLHISRPKYPLSLKRERDGRGFKWTADAATIKVINDAAAVRRDSLSAMRDASIEKRLEKASASINYAAERF